MPWEGLGRVKLAPERIQWFSSYCLPPAHWLLRFPGRVRAPSFILPTPPSKPSDTCQANNLSHLYTKILEIFIQHRFRGGWQHPRSTRTEPTLFGSQVRGHYFHLTKFLLGRGRTLSFQCKWFVKYSFSYTSTLSRVLISNKVSILMHFQWCSRCDNHP